MPRPLVGSDAGQSERCGGSTVSDAGAIEDMFHVFADGGGADEQDAGDVGVALALGGELQHLSLPLAQVREPAAAAVGVEVDLDEVWPEDLEDQSVAFA